jgi:hypothetical protein
MLTPSRTGWRLYLLRMTMPEILMLCHGNFVYESVLETGNYAKGRGRRNMRKVCKAVSVLRVGALADALVHTDMRVTLSDSSNPYGTNDSI